MKLIACALILGLAACSNAVSRNAEEERIANEVEQKMASDACSSDKPYLCSYTTVTFAPQARAADDDVIMIVDVEMSVPALSLHKSRVLNHYKITGAPAYYTPFKPSLRIPSGVASILHETFKGREAMAASAGVKDVGLKFLKKYSKLLEGMSMGHGTTSFNILAELNPKAKFIVVHEDESFSSTPICKLAERDGFNDLEAYWRDRAQALAKIARDNNVKWVNMSSGYSLREAKQLWNEKRCWGTYPSDDDFLWFVDKSNAIPRELTKIPGLLYVQAAPYSNQQLDELTRKDFCADCEQIPGRLRVGYLNLEAGTIPSGKERDTRLLSDVQRHVAPCADLFIRDGKPDEFSFGTNPIQYTALGFGHGAMNVSGTSFIAPVGLSHAAYLMKTKGLSPVDVVKYFRGATNEPLLTAPFKDRHFLNSDASYVNWY